MATFQFHADSKVTMWERATFDIEAETYNQALEKALECVKTGGYPDMTDYETLYDTAEPMSVKDNKGESTLELYHVDNRWGESVWDNKSSIND